MQALSQQPALRWRIGEEFAVRAAQAVLWPLHMLIAVPSLLFFAAMTAMLLRHPDVQFYEIDRLAFGLLVVGVVARGVVLRERLLNIERATWPMIGLTALVLISVSGQPFDRETWNLLASKFIVPFALFHLAGLVFTDESRIRQFEVFALVVLAYLSFTAIAFLCGAHFLIFPRFILDQSVGWHVDRARGPLLQAVANGVSLNLLGLVAVHAYRRGTLRGAKAALLMTSLPLAILATMTRAVWLSFAGTILALTFLSPHRMLRRGCTALALIVGVLVVVAGLCDSQGTFTDRLEERGPVEFREAVYAGSWEMFLERPLTGWGFHRMPGELPRHVSGYDAKVMYPHNTYLELLAEQGVAGLALYLWLMWELWHLGRGAIPSREKDGFLNQHFHRLWPVLLAVYWVNAAVVVMSYQFVNGLLFTMAGMLAAQQRRAVARESW